MASRSNGPGSDLPGVQYLRGIAALMVLIYHVSLQLSQAKIGTEHPNLKSGVDIFFVISGFIMVYSTLGERRTSAVDFIQRRLKRIAPLYWLLTMAMLIVLIVAPRFVKTSILEWRHALASLAFIAWPNPAAPASYLPLVTPGWTLNMEIAFYACFAVGLAIGKTPLKVIMIAATPVVAAGVAGLVLAPRGALGFYTNPVELEFVAGMVLGYIVLRGKLTLPPFAIAVLLAMGFILLLVPPLLDPLYRPFRFGIPASIIVLAGLGVRRNFAPMLHRLGDMSYSLYLSHFFVLSAVVQLWRKLHLFSHAGGIIAFYVVGIFTALAVGLAIWAGLEVPLQRALRKRGRKIDPPGADAKTARA